MVTVPSGWLLGLSTRIWWLALMDWSGSDSAASEGVGTGWFLIFRRRASAARPDRARIAGEVSGCGDVEVFEGGLRALRGAIVLLVGRIDGRLSRPRRASARTPDAPAGTMIPPLMLVATTRISPTGVGAAGINMSDRIGAVAATFEPGLSCPPGANTVSAIIDKATHAPATASTMSRERRSPGLAAADPRSVGRHRDWAFFNGGN